MKRTIFLTLTPLLFLLCGCNKLTPEIAKQSVIKGENERLTFVKQQLLVVEDITIDSMHIIINKEPMSGYLYTTWTSKKNNKERFPIIINVSNIQRNSKNNDLVEWSTDWMSALKTFMYTEIMETL